MKLWLLLTASLVLSLSSCSKGKRGTFLPVEGEKIDPAATEMDAETKKKKIAQILKDYPDLQLAQDIFPPIFKDVYNVELTFTFNFKKTDLNAQAKKKAGQWGIDYWSGLFDLNTISKDGVYVIACHEIGHLVGGFPGGYYPLHDGRGTTVYMSHEGNSDYFSTQACLKKLWEKSDNTKADLSKVPKFLLEKCEEKFAGRDQEISICKRSLAGVESIKQVLNKLSGQNSSMEATDSIVVESTLKDYPKTVQCRIDTYIAGALCDKGWDPSVKWPTNMQELQEQSCTRKDYDDSIYDGVRPKCWFKPEE